jgi:glycosyltransferase involved in cell wall biosynthesis
LRIAILSYTFPRGMGYIGNMLPRHLARLGAEVHYITMDLPHYFQSEGRVESYGGFQGNDVMRPGQVEQYDGFALHCLAHRRSLGQMRYDGLADKLSRIRPQVVQSLLAIGWPPLDAARLRDRFGYRLFTANHTTASVFPLAQRQARRPDAAELVNLLTRFAPGRYISRATDLCYAATVDCADVAVRFFGVERHKVAVVPLGVDTELFRPVASDADRDERAATRARLGIGPNELAFIYTGQFTAAKNPLLLARAVGRMRNDGLAVKGVFVGNGRQAEEIRQQAGCAVLEFMPNRDLPPYYRACDVGVWPTQESTSMLDAAACGLPVVVNDTLQASERIEGNGLKYRLNDLDDLVRTLRQLVDQPELRVRLGGTGAMRMERHFSWRDLASRRLADFEAALARGSVAA